MAQNAITDQGQGNINLEGGELVQNPQGQIQPVYGSRHVENGKIAKGVNANLEDGSRVLSDAKGLIMLSAKDAKELKDRYNISVKKGDTPAQAQKKFDSKIGLKKEQDILANYAEKMEKTLTIKDAKTKQVNLEFLQRSIAKTNTKIDTLSEMSKEVFEDLFNIQEGKPKKGDGTQLYNSKGKEVTEKKEGVMQQGGDYMSNLASQYGISKERAQQLLQMGGQAEQQEPQQSEGIEQQVMQALQEGAQPEEILQQLSQQMPPEQAQQIIEQVMASSQGGQPQQEGSQDIMGMVMEALQNGADPNQVVQGLMEQGVEEQEAVNIVSEMTQGEHQMQSGGQVYAQQAFFKPNKYAKKDYSNQPFIEGMTTVSGDMSDFNGIKERMAIQNQDLPYLVRDSKMYEDSNPNMANIGNFQEAYDNYVKSTLDEIELNKNLTDGEKKQYKEIATKQLLGLSKKSGDYDKVYGDETSTRTKLTLPYVSKKDKEKYGEKLNNLGDVLDDKGGIKEDFKDLDPETKKRILDTYKRQGNKALNIGLGEVSKTADKKAEEPSIGTPAENRARIQYNSTTQNVMPQLPMDLRLAPSAMQPLAKEYVPYGRIDPLKATPEQMLTEQERQRQTDAERVQQSGLSAGQQEAILAQGLAASQMASNDAISKTQDWNNQNQFQVNTFNNQQRTKEAISNANFNQDFQNKTLGSIAATERDWRNYYLESNLQNRADYSSIENANLLKKNSDKYTYIPGQGVKFIGGQSQDIAIPNEYSKAEWQLMTMEERNKAMQKKIDSQKVSQMGGMKKSYFGY